MTRFDKFIAIVFENEGFISNNPNDKGGLTKYGISKSAYPNVDIINLTEDDAKLIYKRDYYDRCKIDLITSELLAVQLFDFAVNAGVGRACRMLQSIIGTKQDGIIGSTSLSVINAGDYSLRYIQARIIYYKQIATGRNIVFLKGWLNRVSKTTNLI